MTGRAAAAPADGYMAIVCAALGCHSELSSDTTAAVRDRVGSSRYGVMVVSGCFFGPVMCRLRPTGQMVVVQPCDVDNAPQGPAVRLGPVRSTADVSAIRACLTNGFHADDIPPHLLAMHRDIQAAAGN